MFARPYAGAPSVALYREMLVNYNEPFILTHAEAFSRYTAYYVGLRRVDGLDIPLDRTIVLNGRENRVGGAEEAAFKLFGLTAPSFLLAIRRTGAAVIHAITGVSGAQALPLAWQLRLPLIVTCTGYEATASRQELERFRYRGRVYLRRLARLKRRASLFLAVSDFVRQRLLAQGFPEARTIVHYVGIDTARFTADPAIPREPVVLFVGRLIPTKGVAHLVRAMSRVAARVPDAEMVVIGDGGLRRDLEQLATELRVRARFLGSRTPDDVRHWMNRARVLCTPSVTAPDGTVEALPAVCAEAQAMGLPISGFASGGIPEGVADGEIGFLAPEGDDARLAEHLTRLLTDEPLWNRVSRAAARRARARFDVQQQARGLETCYDRVRKVPENRTGDRRAYVC